MQFFQAPRLSPDAPQLNPCAWLWKWKGWSCSAPERKFSAPIVLSKPQEVVKTDSVSYTLALLAERITVHIMHRQQSLSGCSLTRQPKASLPCAPAPGSVVRTWTPPACLTFSCRRTRSIKNFQQVSLESTSPRPLTSFLTLLMMFSTSSSGKRSAISPKKRGHVLVYYSGFCCSLRARLPPPSGAQGSPFLQINHCARCPRAPAADKWHRRSFC